MVELPWVLAFVGVNISIAYWVAGLRPSAGSFFFFWFCACVLAAFWLATAVAYSSLLPTLPTAQIVGGLTISVSFLMAGLFLPGARIPAFWRGLYYAVPTSHTLRALGVDQFHCDGGPAAGCPQIQVPASGGGVQTVDRYAFVRGYLGVSYGQRWGQVGWVAVAAAVMAVVAVLALRFVSHQRR